MAYYHVVIEAQENLGKHNEGVREIALFDVIELKSLLLPIILPYLKKENIYINDEEIDYSEIELFAIKQTVFPMQQLIEEQQRELPSNTDITITAFEIFNNHELCQDVTQVIIDLLEED